MTFQSYSYICMNLYSSGIMHSFHCKNMAETAVYFITLPFVMSAGKSKEKNIKHKMNIKNCPTLFIFEGQMLLYLSVYFHFNAADELKQYLKCK